MPVLKTITSQMNIAAQSLNGVSLNGESLHWGDLDAMGGVWGTADLGNIPTLGNGLQLEHEYFGLLWNNSPNFGNNHNNCNGGLLSQGCTLFINRLFINRLFTNPLLTALLTALFSALHPQTGDQPLTIQTQSKYADLLGIQPDYIKPKDSCEGIFSDRASHPILYPVIHLAFNLVSREVLSTWTPLKREVQT